MSLSDTIALCLKELGGDALFCARCDTEVIITDFCDGSGRVLCPCCGKITSVK